MKEDDLKDAVIGLCKLLHLLVHHCRPARLADGTWRTPIQGNPGFVDLVIVGPSGVMWRELKADGKYPDADQRKWSLALQDAGCDWGIWRPADLRNKTIERALKALAKAQNRSSE